jgi:phosphotransferase system enzyme I (PtsI)
MREPPAEQELPGRTASAGLTIAPLVIARDAGHALRVAGTPAEERSALEEAIADARAELAALAGSADPTVAEILGFQLALLEDEELLDPVLARIDTGEAADGAWRAVLDGEIAAYRAGDPVLRARAADLVDLRERVLRVLTPSVAPIEDGPDDGAAILAIDDLTPSRFLETDWSRFRGAVLRRGSTAGHVAMLARARGIPLLVDLGPHFDRLQGGTLAVLDAERGRVIVDPGPDSLAASEARLVIREAAAAHARGLLAEPAITAGGERVQVTLNIDDPAALDRIDPAHTDGIGLVRTEFLFRGAALPDEARQLETCLRVLRWAAGRPVVVRTLDAGGDKPIPGLTPVGESNPFLGLRGLRLALARPEVFRVQLRALARAAAHGPLRVMAPMVTLPAEFAAFRELFVEVVEELAVAGITAARPPLGMMVEVPAAALTAGDFEADFYSIGSNDLIPYLMAASRDEPALAHLLDPAHPAVDELIRRVVEAGRARGVEVSLCGELASDPAQVPRLLALGLRRLSVAPAALGPVKAAIAGWRG